MSFRPLTALCAALLATPAVAETNVYLGLGADYALPHEGEDEFFGSFVAGASFSVWEYVGFGIEGEVGQQLTDGDGRETARVRGMLTYDFGTITGYAAVGAVQYEIDGVNIDGDTVGLGAQMEVLDGVDGRFELIRDFIDDGFEPGVTTSRFALLYKF